MSKLATAIVTLCVRRGCSAREDGETERITIGLEGE
jgi:hypothetical protein